MADTVAADKTHRGHAIIEQVHADLKRFALAHLPSGKFAANSAWLVLAVIAFNLTRAPATLSGPTLAKSTSATIRRADRIIRAAGHSAPPPGCLALGDRASCGRDAAIGMQPLDQADEHGEGFSRLLVQV